MANGLPGPPIGSTNAHKSRMVEQALKRAVMADDGARLRNGVEAQLTKFSEGDQAAAVWVRDTLDGKPKQAIDINEDGNALTSLQVLFVQALTDRLQSNQSLTPPQGSVTIDQPKDT